MEKNYAIRFLNLTLGLGLFFMLACAQPAPAPAEPAAETTPTTDTTAAQSQFSAHCYESRMPDGSALSFQFFDYYGEVVGILDYTFAEKDGAHGTIKGTRDGNMITAKWSYTVEGSEQAEEVVFKLENNKAFKGNGELVEGEDGTLRLKDPAKATWEESFDQVNCKLGQ